MLALGLTGRRLALQRSLDCDDIARLDGPWRVLDVLVDRVPPMCGRIRYHASENAHTLGRNCVLEVPYSMTFGEQPRCPISASANTQSRAVEGIIEVPVLAHSAFATRCPETRAR